jgi:hypothetical protein
MNRAKTTTIGAAVALLALLSTLAAGCYYDRDDDWGYHRHPDRRYSYDYRDRDWRRDWRYDRDHDRRYSRADPFRDHYND